MNVIPIEDKLCEQTLRYLDSYVSNKRMEETQREVLEHLETCSRCSTAFQSRLALKTSLRHAVQSQEVPVGLRKQIQDAVRKEYSSRLKPTLWNQRFLAAAAMLVICLGGWAAFHLVRIAYPIRLSSQLAQEFSPSEQIAAVLKIGIDDHVHCVIDSHLDQVVMKPEEMTRRMGLDYAGLLPLIKDNLPEGFVVSVGHRCQVNGREFIHLVLKHEEKAVSVIITEKQRVSFPVGNQVNSPEVQGVVLHQARLKSLESAGFETKDHLAFVISALDQNENFQIASLLAPPVNDFLNRL